MLQSTSQFKVTSLSC